MIYLLTGSDSFSKKSFLSNLISESKAKLVIIPENHTISDALHLTNSDLFGGSSIAVSYNGIELIQNSEATAIASASSSDKKIVCIIDHIDKRKKDHSTILKNSNFLVKEFNLPSGRELLVWVLNQSKKYNIEFEKSCAEIFLKLLTGQSQDGSKNFRQETDYDLYLIDNELKKLASYANGRKITSEIIKQVVSVSVQSDVFEILNAVSNKNIKSAIISLEQFFKQGSEDEKSKAIHFSAVLSEQLRNALLIQSALANKLSEAQISSETGWKEGRVYMIKRLAQKISRTQIQDCLSKLEHLDVELKTSTAPPRIFIDLILNKLTV